MNQISEDLYQLHYHDYTPAGEVKPLRLYHSHAGKIIKEEDGHVTHDHMLQTPVFVDVDGAFDKPKEKAPPDRSSRKRTTNQIVPASKPELYQACGTGQFYDCD